MKLNDIQGFWTREEIEKCDARCEGTTTIQGLCYKKDSETGRLKYDEEATVARAKYENEYEDRRKDLWFALRSRVLTDEEMKRVEQMGTSLMFPSRGMCSYNANDVEKQFNEALLQQFKMRLLVAEAIQRK